MGGRDALRNIQVLAMPRDIRDGSRRQAPFCLGFYLNLEQPPSPFPRKKLFEFVIHSRFLSGSNCC